MATAPPPAMATNIPDEKTELSERYEKLDGAGPEPFGAVQALKDKIKLHYDLASDYYLSLWGEHIHHGYWTPPTQDITKEVAQANLIKLLLEISSVVPSPATTNTPIRVLDVGCGIGGTSRYLARTHGCHVTGITISTKQVEIAKRLSLNESPNTTEDADGFISISPDQHDDAKSSIPANTTTITTGGKVKFIELDAEKMSDHFATSTSTFDVVWISEALSHFPNKPLFFANAQKVLKQGGKLVIADWFKNEGLTEKEFADDVKPIEDGMLLPPLRSSAEYVGMAEEAGLKVIGGPKDISKEVARTWDITWSLIQSPSLWAFAFSQGRDGVAFLQAFRAMRRGYANGTFRYAVMAFQK